MEIEEIGGLKALSLDAKMAEIATLKPNTVVLFGDSITAQNTDDLFTYYNAKGYFTWANIILGHRLNLIKNAGISGNTTAQMLARIDTDVIAYKPSYCIVPCGINDITTAVPKATTITNLQNIYEKLISNKITVIACTILPATDVDTVTEKDALYSINNWIKEYSWSKKDIILCNWHHVICDQATGTPLANTTSDGKHPSLYGAGLLGKFMADILSPIIPKFDTLLSSNFDSTNLIVNGMTLGNNSGVATSFSVNAVGSPTLTKTKVVRSDGLPGELQQISNAVAASGAFLDNLHHLVQY